MHRRKTLFARSWPTVNPNYNLLAAQFLGCCRPRLKCDGTSAETRFRLSAKRTSPFKSARRRRQFSRLLAAEVCASAVVMLDTPCSVVVWRVLATHSIRQFPLHFPSRASPCAITFQLESWMYWPLKKGPIVCPETSVGNYHYTLCNISEERRCQVLYFEGWLNAFRNLIACDLGTCIPVRTNCGFCSGSISFEI